MIFAIMVLLVSGLLVAGAFAAVNGDIGLTHTNTAQEKAYYAALAGIQVYEYQLNTNPNYWTSCPSASNVSVPGTSDETYSYETRPATGHGVCESGKSMSIIESANSANGTFRIKSTGVSGKETRSIVATFTHPGFLNYVYVTNYEVLDPLAQSPEPANCEHYYKYRVEHPPLVSDCGTIQFAPKDKVSGPLHTNDAAAICAEGASAPTFGRTAKDQIEMNGGHYAAGGACSNSPNLIGTYTEQGPTLLPPETSTELLEAAGYTFSGKTVIELNAGSPNTMTVTLSGGAKETKPFPINGVVYVKNSPSCGIKYTPFNSDYSGDTNCGNVYIKGTYTESLTVGAANDVIVIGNLTTSAEGSGKPIGGATLGLIATNFVRVYHPVQQSYPAEGVKKNTCSKGGTLNGSTCEFTNNSSGCNAANLNASEDPKGWGWLETPVIDAAILSTKHSWIVDNFKCGSGLGVLTVWGAIAQFWRGPVGTGNGSSGYTKNYNYDDRLATEQPPSFLSPTSTGGWKITRETSP